MKHPCKKCLVRAVCTPRIQCPEWNKYSNFAAYLLTIIAIITGSIVMGSTLIYLNIKLTNTDSEYRVLLVVFWILSITLNHCFDGSLKADCGFFMKWFLAPVLTWFYIILFSTKKYFKRA